MFVFVFVFIFVFVCLFICNRTYQTPFFLGVNLILNRIMHGVIHKLSCRNKVIKHTVHYLKDTHKFGCTKINNQGKMLKK